MALPRDERECLRSETWVFRRMVEARRLRGTPPNPLTPVFISIQNNREINFISIQTGDTVAEWLRRGPAKLVGYARASSILVGVGNFLEFLGRRSVSANCSFFSLSLSRFERTV